MKGKTIQNPVYVCSNLNQKAIIGMNVLKTIGWSLQTLRPSLGLVNSLTEGFFAVEVPFGLGSLLGSGCGGQNVL
jgi:hypothetical protein